MARFAGMTLGDRFTGRRWLSTELLLGLGLNSFLAAMLVGGMEGVYPVLSVIALVALVAVVAAVVWNEPSRYRLGELLMLGAFLLVGAIVLGYAVNVDRYTLVFIVGNLGSTIIALAMAYVLATRRQLDYRLLLAWHEVFAAALLPIPIAAGTLVWGRLVGRAFNGQDVHPNYLGLIALLIFIGGLGIRMRALKLALMLGAGAVMLLASSRTSIVSAAIAAFCYGACRLSMPVPRRLQARHSRSLAIAFLTVTLLLVVLDAAGYSPVQFVSYALLKINDPYRGLSSGASGRSELWDAAIEIWSARPLLGIGFRGHRALMPTGELAHSGYLGTLADTGVLGLAGFLLLCAVAVQGAVKLRHDPSRQTAIALVISYLAYAVFESRALGFGNPYSMLFLWIAFDVARQPFAERKAARNPSAPSAARRSEVDASAIPPAWMTRPGPHQELQ